MSEKTPLGLRLKAARELTGVSAMGLSIAAGVARDAVRKVEEGDIENPGAEFLRAVVGVLGEDVSLDWLVSGLGAAPTVADVAGAAERVRAAMALRRAG